MSFDQQIRSSVHSLMDDVASGKLDRRAFFSRVLASTGAAGLAYALAASANAQDATPSASPVAGEVAGYHSPEFDGELAEDQVVRLTMTEPRHMDPGVSVGYDELAIFPNIFEGITELDARTGDVIGRMAESWEFNDDATEFTFKLREDLRWSDGVAINANDFVYSWQRVLLPETASLYGPALHPIKNAVAVEAGEMDVAELGVEAVDDYTLKVTLEASTPYFPLLATTWTYSPVPKHKIDEFAEQWVEAENIVCSGPYVMTEWTHDLQITLEPNPEYYGDAPTVTRAVYTIFADDSTQSLLAYENDEIDIVPLAGTQLEEATANQDLADQLHSFEGSNVRYIVCDVTTEPTSNLDFRHAVYSAIDRETLVTAVLKGQCTAAYTMLPPDVPGHNPDAAMEDSPEAAQAALEASGVDAGATEIELSFPTSSQRNQLVAEYLQNQLQNVLGIKVRLNPVEDGAWNDWRESRADQPFHIRLGTWGSDFSDASNWFNQNWVSAADADVSHWVNEEFDALCAEAATNTNPEERVQQYQEAEAILVQDAALIPVYRADVYFAVKPNIYGVHLQPVLPYVHLRYVQVAAA